MQVFILIGIGVVLGGIDILQMIKQKLDRCSIGSAFVFHLIMPWVLYANRWEMATWLKGGILYAIMALPIAILAYKDDKTAAPIMLVSSLVLGMIAGFGIQML